MRVRKGRKEEGGMVREDKDAKLIKIWDGFNRDDSVQGNGVKWWRKPEVRVGGKLRGRMGWKNGDRGGKGRV